MKRATLIAKLQSYLPCYSEKCKISELQQNLKDKDDLLKESNEQRDILKQELAFSYTVFLKNKRCIYRLEIDEKYGFVLLVINNDVIKRNILVYIPRKHVEVATIYTQIIDDVLVIQDIALDFLVCEIAIGRLFLEELIIQADASGASAIVGHFGRIQNVSFSEQVAFYKKIGFQVLINSEEELGSISYTLKNAQS